MARNRGRARGRSNQPQLSNNPSTFREALEYMQLDRIQRDGLLAAVNIITEFASTRGLTEDTLNLFVDMIGSCKFSVVISKKIISFLTPSVCVPEDAIISALSWICTRKMSVTLQILLMRWIVASYTYDVIDSTVRLHLLYDVVFCLLQYSELCPQVCHLLFLLARKENVKLYHVQKLIRLQSRLGSQPYIMGLLNIYHRFRPEYLTIAPRLSKYFHTNKQWQHLANVPRRAAFVAGMSSPAKRSNGRRLMRFQDLVSAMEGLKNVATVLGSEHRRLMITSYEDIVAKLNLQFMLQLNYEWDGGEENEEGRKLLKTMANVLAETREQLTTKEYFMPYLQTWKGQRFFPEFLRIIPHLLDDLSTFDDLMDVCQAVHNLTCTSPVPFQLEFIDNLTCLFKNFVLFKYNPEIGDRDTQEDHLSLLFGLASYIDNLCVLGSMQHPEKEGIFLFVALDFYSLVVHLIELGYLNLLVIPSVSLVCAALFSFSASHLSQVCLLISRYRLATAKLKSSSFSLGERMLSEGIEALNSYIVNIFNTVWRCNGFVPTPNSHVFDDKLPTAVQDTVRVPREVFAAYRHPALIVCVRAFLERLKDQDIEPRDIVSNRLVKNVFFQHISDYSFNGIVSFMQTFSKSKTTV